MQHFGITDIGMKRKNNQDTFRIEATADYTLAVVCDGMGGAAGGGVASRLACDEFISSMTVLLRTAAVAETPDDEIINMLIESGNASNRAVYDQANEHAELEGMGTTLVACLCLKNKLYVISAGDSRMYIMKKTGKCRKLLQITKDHSLVQELYEKGKITREEAMTHPYKNYILRALGTEERVSYDYFIVEPPFESVLLCTDGLTNFVSDEEITAILKSGLAIDSKVNELVRCANEGGGGDNITAVLLSD